jgi:hypothetical protein
MTTIASQLESYRSALAAATANGDQAVARKLGFSGMLIEREHLLPGNAR